MNDETVWPNSPSQGSMDEKPGMLALAEGVRNQTWPHTVDAQIWVREWIKTVSANPAIPLDEGCMIGWFANAIMAGYDTAQFRASEKKE